MLQPMNEEELMAGMGGMDPAPMMPMMDEMDARGIDETLDLPMPEVGNGAPAKRRTNNKKSNPKKPKVRGKKAPKPRKSSGGGSTGQKVIKDW